MEIKVIDAMCGIGKTSAAINFINEASEDTHFIYITPFLDEVARIKSACSSRRFVEPEGGSKLINLKVLLGKGANIVTTHALFQLFDDEVIDLCQYQDYTLIMDEVTNVIEAYDISDDDKQLLFDYYLKKEDNGLLSWVDPDGDPYSGRFDDVKRLANMGCLACYGQDILVWLFPVKVFNAFRDSYILTYLFDAQMQRYYYDYYGMNYKYLYVKDFHFTDEPQTYRDAYNYGKLVSVLDDCKLNQVGEAEHALSKNWFIRNRNNVLMKQLAQNTANFFRHKMNCNSKDTLWTTFKDYRPVIKGKGFGKGFLPVNARATNDYQDRHAVAYLANRYVNPQIAQFFRDNGITVDEDAFALSEMIQFIWRSAIRNGEPITVYIPSRRMRELLINWLSSH